MRQPCIGIPWTWSWKVVWMRHWRCRSAPENWIRYSFVERFGGVQGGGEFVPAQKQPDVDFFAVQVPGSEVEGPLKCVLGLGVEADIGSFACAPGQRHGHEVVAGVLGGFLFDRLSGLRA